MKRETRSFSSLVHRLIIRDAAGNPVRSLLTVGGVALGIAVVVAVQVANERAVRSFDQSLELLSGSADLSITRNGLPIGEELLGQLAWVRDVGNLTAVVEGSAEIVGIASARPVRIFGADLLSEAGFRAYPTAAGEGNLGRDEFLDLLVDPAAIAVPESLAIELGADRGEEIDLGLGNSIHRFRVAALLADTGVAAAFGGRIVVMDIAAAQWALDRLGEIDRIEIVLEEGVTPETVAARLRAELGDSHLVTLPSRDAAPTERITRAFRYNLNALSYIALAVGVILVYNTLELAVTRRQTEIGMLRTLGVGTRTIRNMFLVEAGLFGAAGAMVGFEAGVLLADAAGEMVSRTISTLYTGVPAATGGDRPGWTLHAAMLALGMVLAAVSGSGPALRAMRVTPVEALGGTRGAGGSGRVLVRRPTLVGLAALTAGAALSMAPPVGGFPLPGYAAGVMFIVGFGFLVRRFAGLAASLVHRWAADRLPAEARLALQTVEDRLPRLSVAVVSLMIAVAMLISVAIMVAGFRETIVVWVDQTLQGDLYLRPASPGPDGGRNVMDPDLPDRVAGLPGVAAVERFRSVSIEFGGFGATMAASDLRTLAARSRLLFQDGRQTPEVVERLIGSDRVVVSEPFAVRHRVATGDTILLPSRDGEAPFEVEAVFYDYSTEGGLILMDRATWIRQTGDEAVSNIAVYLEPGADLPEVRERVAGLVGTRARISANASIRDQILRVFDQTFEVTYALEAIALAAAMLGIANTLAALVLERGPELAMLRFVGASRQQIRRMIVIEAGFVGLLGILIGLALGLVLSILLVYVINFQSFGWTIQFALPAGFLLQAVLAVMAATLAAGYYPATLALRVDPLRGIRAE